MILYVITWHQNSQVDLYPPSILTNSWYSNMYNYWYEYSINGVDGLQNYLNTHSIVNPVITDYFTTWQTDVVNSLVFNTLEEANSWVNSYKLSDPILENDYLTWNQANNIQKNEHWFELTGNEFQNNNILPG